MNFEALPSNCFNIGKKVKMKVTSAVPLCLLAGMAIVTCGCTAMKLRSEDPAVRMEAVKSYTTVEDWFDIAISDYPEDVRLYAFKQLTCDQEKLDDAIRIATTRYYGPSSVNGKSINDGKGWYFYGEISRLDNVSEEVFRQIISLASKEACQKIIEDKSSSYSRIGALVTTVLKKDTTGEFVKSIEYYGQNPYRDYLKSLILAATDKNEVVALLDLADKGAILKEMKAFPLCLEFDGEQALALLKRFDDAQLQVRILWHTGYRGTGGGRRGGEVAKFVIENFSKFPDDLFPRVYEIMYADVDKATQMAWNRRHVLKDPKSEFALNLLFNSELDTESVARVLENNAPDIILEKVKEGALLDKITNKSNGYSYSVKKEDMARFLKDPKGTAKEEIKSYRWYANDRWYADGYEGRLTFIDLLNASPAWAAKIDPALAATLLEIDYYVYERAGHDSGEHSTKPLMGKSYESLSPQIAKAFLERGITYCDEGLCPVYKTLLRNVPLQTVYEIVKKKTGLTPRFYETMAGLINARELNDETVEALLKLEFAPSAVGVRRLQAALKAKGVSDASKAKIRAYIEKVRAEAVANEAKAKEVRLVIDHCYVGMREIDHIVLPPQKGVMYGEKNGIITSFGWTAKQCYDWFEIENDRFQWEFAKKFGLSNFKFDMSVKAESQTSFNPELLLFDAMSGADTAVVSVPKISVQQWWLSTTRERGKNVEFLYNEEDKNNTLIMREIQ